MHIYISSLGRKVTDESLKATFVTYGKVSSAKVLVDSLTGASKGYAFTEMPDKT